MLLTQFLSFYFNVDFEYKYNYLGIKEILDHKYKYPRVYDTIYNMLDYDENYDENGQLIENDYDQSYFDIDINADEYSHFDECYELYKAFVNVILQDKIKNKCKIRSFKFGTHYLRFPSLEGVAGNEHFYNGRCEITFFEDELNIIKVKKEPRIYNKTLVGHIKGKLEKYFYYQDNDKILKELTKGLQEVVKKDLVFVNRFDEKELASNKRITDNEVINESYVYDYYEFVIGDNTIKLFSTERGFDALALLRNPILNNLTEEQKKLDIVQQIINQN